MPAKNAATKTKTAAKTTPSRSATKTKSVATAASTSFAEVEAQLWKLFAPFEKQFKVKMSNGGRWLVLPYSSKWKKELWFGGTRSGNAYVSLHFVPMYMYPEMLSEISPDLRKRMQGMACFNFKSVDKAQLKELSGLLKKGLARLKKEGDLAS